MFDSITGRDVAGLPILSLLFLFVALGLDGSLKPRCSLELAGIGDVKAYVTLQLDLYILYAVSQNLKGNTRFHLID